MGIRRHRHLSPLVAAFLVTLLLANCSLGVRTVLPTPAPLPTDGSQPTSPPPPKPTVTPQTGGVTPIADILPAGEGWTTYLGVNEVRGVAFASDSIIWAATTGGAVRWDLTNDSHTVFIKTDGLASNLTHDVAVAPDGTVWFATSGGVSSYNGSDWKTYTMADRLPSNAVYALDVATDGAVWAGTDKGVSRFARGRWTTYTTADGLADNLVWDIVAGPDGDVWYATASGGVSRYTPTRNRWTTYTAKDGLPNNGARSLAVGPQGDAWVYIAYQGVYRFAGSRWQMAYESPGQWVCDFAFAKDGTPWIATCGGWHARGGGLLKRDGSQGWATINTQQGLASNDVNAVAIARNGDVAAATTAGLGVLQGGKWRTLRWGPARNKVTTVAITPDGAVWSGFGDYQVVQDAGGLSRFDGQTWRYFTSVGGFPISDHVQMVEVGPDGALWLGAGCNLVRFDGQTWQTLLNCEGDFGNIQDIAFAPDGAVWVATFFRVIRLQGSDRTVHDVVPSSLAVATDGSVWVGHLPIVGGGVSRLDSTGWITYTEDFTQGVLALAATPDGSVWLEAVGRGLLRFDGQAWRSYTDADGLPGSHAFVLTVAPDGTLWASTGSGLAHFVGDTWQHYPASGGLAQVGIHDIAVAPDGTLWLATGNGLVRFRPKD
ncbi:MAG: hypothetical protein IT330_11140 [Anaerolineae bacterium]|nr:hypothetical protein [Anaerolineae bacterium]